MHTSFAPLSRPARHLLAGSTLALLCLASLTHAQTRFDAGLNTAATLQDSAASTPVPALNYRSPFQGMATGVEAQVLDWKQSNATVGQFPRGHADVLKWEQSSTGKPAPAPTQEPAHHAH